MQRERELLVKQVFPELRCICTQRFVTITEVDLRWGITEEQAAEGKVLPISLEEIHLSRPYFIGLLGERYGWIPQSVPDSVIAKEPWLQEHIGHCTSVTELEILHGALNNPQMASHAYFYFRDPKYLESLPEAERLEMLERDIPADARAFGEAEATRRTIERKAKLASLKQRIRQSGLPLLENYRNPEALAAAVREHLLALIDRLYSENATPNQIDQESLGHKSYAAHKLLAYVPRPVHTAALDTFALTESTGQGLVVTGASGGGKTVLLADWVRRWRESHPNDFVFAHYFGSTPDSTSVPRFLHRLLSELKQLANIHEEIPFTSDKMREALPIWLAQSVGRGAIVLVLDALNQIEGDESDRWLTWLPHHFPPHVRVLASALPGPALDILNERGWTEQNLPLPDAAERGQMIDQFFRHYRKEAGGKLRDQLAAAPGSANALFLRTVLEELRQFGNFEQLPAKVAEYLTATTPEELFQLVLRRWQQDFDADRDLVRLALCQLWAARQGLSEIEWREFLGTPDGPLLGQIWSPLFLAIEPHLALRGGLHVFGHEFLRQAVATEFLPDEADRHAIHLALADYFATQGYWINPLGDEEKPTRRLPLEPRSVNLRKVVELPWQRRRAAQWDQLTSVLTDWEYLEACAEGGTVFRLMGEYAEALGSLSKEHTFYGTLELILRFLDESSWAISTNPMVLFQQAYNSLMWDSTIDSRVHRWLRNHELRSRRIWLKRLNKPILIVVDKPSRTLLRHRLPVTSLMLTADGRYLASGEGDWGIHSDVLIWDARSGRLRATLTGHRSKVNTLVFSPDGRSLISGSHDLSEANHIGYWNSKSGTYITTLKTANEFIVWDLATESPIWTEGLENGIRSIACSPDGNRVCIASGTGFAVYDLSSRRKVWSSGWKHDHWVILVAFSPDSRSLVSVGYDNRVHLWDSSTGQPLRSLEGIPIGDVIAVSSDHRYIATVTGTILRVLDLSTGLHVVKKEGLPEAASISFAPDDIRVVTGHYDGRARVWNIRTGEQADMIECDVGVVTALTFSIRNSQFACGGHSGKIQIWDSWANRRKTSEPKLTGRHDTYISAAAFSRDGSRLATGDTYGGLQVWEVSTSCPVGDAVKCGSYEGHNPNNCISGIDYSGNMNCIAVLGCHGRLYVVDYERREILTQQSPFHLRHIHEGTYSPAGRGLAFSPDDGFLATVIGSHIEVWETDKWQPHRDLIGHYDEKHCLAFSRDRNLLVAGSASQSPEGCPVRVWDGYSTDFSLLLGRHTAPVGGVAVSPEGRFIASAGADGYVKIWKLAPPALERILPLDGEPGPVAFSPDGRFLAIGSSRSITIWCLTDGLPLAWLPCSARVLSIRFASESHELFVADSGGPAFVPAIYHLKLVE